MATPRYNFLAHQNYGMDEKRQQELTPEDCELFARAVLTIAAADGLSDAERTYFANHSRAMETPEEVIQKYLSYDTKSSSLEALLAPIRGKSPVPYLLYDAIKVASVDGYHDAERAKVREAAKTLGVSEEHVKALEGLVAAEGSVRDARLALFAVLEKK